MNILAGRYDSNIVTFPLLLRFDVGTTLSHTPEIAHGFHKAILKLWKVDQERH